MIISGSDFFIRLWNYRPSTLYPLSPTPIIFPPTHPVGVSVIEEKQGGRQLVGDIAITVCPSPPRIINLNTCPRPTRIAAHDK